MRLISTGQGICGCRSRFFWESPIKEGVLVLMECWGAGVFELGGLVLRICGVKIGQ